MASNTYKISQLAAQLQTILAEQGDLDVVVPAVGAGLVYAVQLRDLLPQHGFSFQKLSQPVLSIEPKAEYQTTDTPGVDWNHDLSAAPEGVTLRVFKRLGGADTGQRHGDVWTVFEGGSRAWEIAPGGILGWAVLP